MDWSEINARVEKMACERKEQLKAERTTMLGVLREAGVTRIEASYDGYGDSGNVEDVMIETQGAKLDAEQDKKLKDFLWDVPYTLHPGFEINEGGCGEVVWDVLEDKIDVSHSDRFVDTNHYDHEDV
ncbi:DUF6878 family protein [uncultured Ruegeria sp.]|uniref:DUF6878 family protein n=1 Tax=uncultured Ruegeria sp. TaxID=259304 RepID=UPI002603683B|nr:DUF6878 family protein [uncultured Ruegeria sp.]